ncbi:carbon-nitrogen hydrolase family protein [candidate division KSB1 bacterium]
MDILNLYNSYKLKNKLKIILTLFLVFSFFGKLLNLNAQEKKSSPEYLKTAAVQFRSTDNLAENVKKMCEFIKKCAEDGVRIVIFPECSVSGYKTNKEWIKKFTPEMLKNAEEKIQTACKEANIYSIVGIPWFTSDKVWDSAVVIDPNGEIIERYGKLYLAGEKWAVSGDHLALFEIDRIPATLIICHDERYPELVRIPAMMGAKILFYISSESSIKQESKIVPYRSQIVARAVENNIWVVHSNAPANPEDLSGSHGQSRIIKPDGNIVIEASIFKEEVITHNLDISKASRGIPLKSLKSELFGDWWREGMKFVKNK